MCRIKISPSFRRFRSTINSRTKGFLLKPIRYLSIGRGYWWTRIRILSLKVIRSRWTMNCIRSILRYWREGDAKGARSRLGQGGGDGSIWWYQHPRSTDRALPAKQSQHSKSFILSLPRLDRLPDPRHDLDHRANFPLLPPPSDCILNHRLYSSISKCHLLYDTATTPIPTPLSLTPSRHRLRASTTKVSTHRVYSNRKRRFSVPAF